MECSVIFQYYKEYDHIKVISYYHLKYLSLLCVGDIKNLSILKEAVICC